MKKRIFSLLLSFVLILAVALPVSAAVKSTQIIITPDKTTAKPGETLTFTLSLSAVSDLGSFQMNLSVPNGLTYVAGSFSVENGLVSTLGYEKVEWVENTKLFYGYTASNDYATTSVTKLATFKCKINSSFSGTVQTGLTGLEFSSLDSDPPTVITSRFSVASTAVTVTKPQQRINFSDVNYNDWYGKSVEYAVGAGLMKGYANTTRFGTFDGIQRQDFVIILARLSGENYESYAGKPNFKDVPKGAYYESALAWAKARGVSNGYDGITFGVGKKVTREQIMTFLHNYANKMGFQIIVSETENSLRAKFPDFPSISGYAKAPVIWAISNGVVGGKKKNGGSYIDPQANAMRCEVATMFYNIEVNNVFVKP